MRPIDNRRKTKRVLKVIGSLIVLVAVLWFVKLTLWSDINGFFTAGNPAYTATANENMIASQQQELLMQDEVLHGHLSSLQKLDKEFTSLLTNTANKERLVEMNARISLAENYFGESIDSIAKEMLNQPNKVDESLFANLLNSFRLALENRRAISNLRDAVSSDEVNLNGEKMLILKFKNELLSKETRIAGLENALKVMQVNLSKRTTTPAAAAPVISKTRVVNAPVDLLKEEDNGTKEKIAERDNKIASLTTTNNLMQKEYDRLVKQYNEAKKDLENNDVKSRNVTLEKKVDELNTELRLAQVDCNLARADATQIVSNPKQRKILLSEASAILNTFSKSENTTVQKKVQDKIIRLNQVAKNYNN